MALHDIVKKGSTDRSVTVRIIDSGDGTPETGVVFNTSGIDLWYRREGAAKTSITEATLAALTTAHSDGGFLHIGDGEYRLDLPDAAFATSANYVDFGGTVTGMIVIGGRVRLVDVDVEDTVRMGLTALPNAAAAAPGGMFVRGTGAGAINQDANGRIDVNAVAQSGTALTARDIGASVLLSSGTGTGQVSLSSGLVRLSGTGVDDLWDEAVDGSYTAREMCRVIMATLAGQASGLGTTTALYKDRTGSKTRITATVDADGNRAAVVFTDIT